MKTTKQFVYSKILKTLSDDVRFDIVMLLSTGPKCVCEIFEKLKLKQSIVSHHLGVLRENGLVEANRNGKWVYYAVNKKKLMELQQFIEKVILTKEKKSKC